MNYRECYDKGKEALQTAGVPEAELNARLLLEYVCDTDRNTLLVHGDREVTATEQEAYATLIEKRRSRIPLQHLTGVQNFMGLDFQVNEHSGREACAVGTLEHIGVEMQFSRRDSGFGAYAQLSRGCGDHSQHKHEYEQHSLHRRKVFANLTDYFRFSSRRTEKIAQ